MNPLHFIFLFGPLAAKAQGFTSIQGILGAVGNIIDTLIPVVFALALLLFFWGIIKVFRAEGDGEGIKSGRRVMMWGILVLFVMSSIWAITSLIRFNVIGLG